MNFTSLITIWATLLLAGCARRSGPDYGPIGDGMKMIAICLVLSAAVGALAELIISGNDNDNDNDDRRP